MPSQNPMSMPEPWSLVAEGYVTESQPAFAQYCREALEVAGFKGAGTVLDVACGPGTLSLLIQREAREVHAIDFAPGMLACFDREIARRGIANITTYRMDGQNLEFADDSFDWAFSIFGLMFFPDRQRGFREMLRTLRPGGRAAVTAWAPVSDSTAMQAMFGAMQAAFPRRPEADSAKVLTLEDPGNFRREMQQAGFVDVSITPFDGDWPVADVEVFFDSMVRGSAPITLLKSSLSEVVWAEKRTIMLEHLRARLIHLPTILTSRAWIGVGMKA
ncbi:MAG: class I SAM-dependent methyltransferase [Burkholderiales bacterium]|nr:class I SAM-dependent methyltransferase [Burkholderiales bacterium]